MSILALIILLTVIVPDSAGIIHDNQSNYSNGILVHQSLENDAQTDYNNGIIIITDSVLLDVEATPTPVITTTSTPSSSIGSGGSGGGSGGGGGGGGSPPSPEDYTNIAKAEKQEKYWQGGQEIVYEMRTLETIQSIAIIPKASVGLIEIRVEELKKQSNITNASIPENYLPYKFFNVWTSTTALANIKEVMIQIKAPFSNAAVMKYKNGSWIQLDVSAVSTAGGESIYDVITDGFSSFVIVRMSGISGAPFSAPPETTGLSLAKSIHVQEQAQETPVPVKENGWMKTTGIFWIAGAITAIIVIAVIIREKKKSV